MTTDELIEQIKSRESPDGLTAGEVHIVIGEIVTLVRTHCSRLDESEQALKSLLARIHGPGGHFHTEARGLALSCLDAHEVLSDRQRELSEAKAAVLQLRRRTGWAL